MYSLFSILDGIFIGIIAILAKIELTNPLFWVLVIGNALLVHIIAFFANKN
jgi:hypothetical protein